MKDESKVHTPDDYDKYISAELPDQKKYPELHRLMCKHTMHGPCGVLNRKCPCMIDGNCHFHYPYYFYETTQRGKSSYPIYRRRDDGQKVKIRKEWLDNRWVVPYNPILLMRYNYHINVEVCNSIKCAKYLYKYVFKGHDRVCFSIDGAQANMEGQPWVINEIKRPIGYTVFLCMICHLLCYKCKFTLISGMHMVAYKARDDLNNVVQNPNSQRSMLT